MNRNLEVRLGDEGRLVGQLFYNQQGTRESAAFEYAAAWLGDPDAFAIDPALPLVTGPQYAPKRADGSVFPAAIADTAPDGWGKRVIQRDHAKRRAEARRTGQPVENRTLNALDFLLMIDDFSRVGALRFRDPETGYQRGAEDGRRTTPPIIELDRLLAGSRAFETNTETAADLAYLRGHGTSLGGLRPKCTVVDNDGVLMIGKFPSVQDERPVTMGEVLALRLAKLAGINTAEARLVAVGNDPVALIRRFDRAPDGGRLMYVSAATMLSVDPGTGEDHFYTEIVDALRTFSVDAQADTEELWRRMALSILINNVDDHLLNHGFLHVNRGTWRLSPAFDVNPFPDRARELKTWVSEDAGPDATIEALMSVTGYFRIKPQRARDLLAPVEAAVNRWREQGRALGITAAQLDQFAEAFEHPERDAARAILR